ncbi:ABC transporter, ATP-binding protein [gut metagenome]|uniref:ABC transporter, ATP-binding protein n=1 Tax=gut metagenome TaxID=749906 RepID=J9GRT6_9ZZZZ
MGPEKYTAKKSAGIRQPTRGKVSVPKDCVIAYLPQRLMTEDGRTIFEKTTQAFAHLHEMNISVEFTNFWKQRKWNHSTNWNTTINLHNSKGVFIFAAKQKNNHDEDKSSLDQLSAFSQHTNTGSARYASSSSHQRLDVYEK